MHSSTSDFPDTKSVPFTRIDTLLELVETLKSEGVPAERYFEQAGIPLICLNQRGTSIPVVLAGRFFDLVSEKEGLEDLGLAMGFQHNAMDDFGSYSVLMRQSPTCLSYLENGSREITKLITGTALWLSWDIRGARFNILHPGVREGWGVQPALFMLAATLSTLRRISRNHWSPSEIDLPHGIVLGKTAENLLKGTPVRYRAGPISFRVETNLLKTVLALPSVGISDDLRTQDLPLSFSNSVEQTIWLLLQDGRCTLNHAAEATGMHPRQLQRMLKSEGCTFNSLLKAQRHRMAVALLMQRELSVTEISAQLGYTDTSNFARAFRLTSGCSPSVYRQEKA